MAVMGPSGSGKITLLNCISCYIPFEDGTITLDGQELKGLRENELARVRNEKLGFVYSKSSRAVIDSFENARQHLDATIFMVTHDSFAAIKEMSEE